MALIDAVNAACNRLAKKGWAELLQRHGLNIRKSNLAAELRRPLKVDRGAPGFEDFCAAGKRGIEPRKPAASLLYHAFASPRVHPTPNGEAVDANDAYPTLAELEALENYIFGIEPLKPGALKNLSVVVFAYQYRPASSTAHGYHADLAFSRTGVSRVGTGPAAWDGPCRGFRSDPPGRRDVAVSPARFGVFLAQRREADSADPIMGRRDQDDQIRAFYFPVHKLFPGDECVAGATITLNFDEYHRNDKLRRVHKAGGISVVPGFDIEAFPFVRDSLNAGDLVELRPGAGSVVVVPVPHNTLVRTARQKNNVSDKSEIVRFQVPPSTVRSRFDSSLTIEAEGPARRAPEYLNIRHRVIADGASHVIEDLQTLSSTDFKKFVLTQGGYEAAHFVDDSCDGAVVVSVVGLPTELPNLPAYSLVTAPDFFPMCDQFEITNWVRESFQNAQEHFSQSAPWPLCEGRRPANLELPRPGSQDKAFLADDSTVAAVVGLPPLSIERHAPDRKKRFSSFLPDAASNVFAPGWDVSLGISDGTLYYAAYGLGSPFPEDAKLCAAINSYWPAVAPDASRTFRNQDAPTAMPLLDRELGYHPEHPKVTAGVVKRSEGWDGEYGPFLQTVGGKQWVNFASSERSDYVSNALRKAITVRLTAQVGSNEMIERMEALRHCVKVLPPGNDRVSRTNLWLVSAEQILDWTLEPTRAKSKLVGPGFSYLFVTAEGNEKSTNEVTRLRIRVGQKFECQIAGEIVFWRKDQEAWQPPE
jgi:hypothetical protein